MALQKRKSRRQNNMKKIVKIGLLSLAVFSLVACGTDAKEVTYEEAVVYSRKNYSQQEAFDTYASVTFKRTVSVLEEQYNDYDGDQSKKEQAEKNKEVLELVKQWMPTSETKTDEFNSIEDLNPFFFNEGLIDEYKKDYSAPEIPPVYQIEKGCIKIYSTYSKPIDEAVLKQQFHIEGHPQGGQATRSDVASTSKGLMASTVGTSAIAINVDGDKDNVADVVFVCKIVVEFTWNQR